MRLLKLSAVFTAVILLLSLTVQTVYAGTVAINTTADSNTPGDGSCSLREAINDSNAGSNVSGDCTGISGTTNTFLIPAGDYTVGSTLPNITSNITLSKVGGGTVNIQANAAAHVAVYRVFVVSSGGSLTLNTVVVRNGGNGSSSPELGGCIYVNGTLILQSSSVNNCFATQAGGGIFASTGSNVTITSSTVSSNQVIFAGAGIYCTACSLTITSATISSNAAIGPFAATGAAGVYCNACTLSISGTTFSSNTVTNTAGPAYAGALVIEELGSYTISNSTFTGNSATSSSIAYGGAVALVIGNPAVSISGSILSGNTSGSVGGAIAILSGTLTLSTSRVFSNTATTNGDAIYSQANSGTTTIRQSCITNNGDTAVFDTAASGTIDATGGGNVADANWWGTTWGPRISEAGAGTGSEVSNGDSINGNGDTVSGNILVDVNLSNPSDYNGIPTGEWLTTAPFVAGATCQVCAEVSSTGHGRTCN